MARPPVDLGRAIERALTSRGALVGIVLLGAALRLWQYGANASLWADEGNMALNLVTRPAAALLGPLDHRQVAPVGWLLAEKGLVTLLGDGEPVLRLVPLLASLAVLPLAWRLAARLLPGPAVPLAVALVALAIPLVGYAAQVKPYASDMAAGLVILLLALELGRPEVSVGRACWLGLAGALTAWLSHPAILALAATGAGLSGLTLFERDGRARAASGPLALAVALWAASAAAAALVARRSLTPADSAYMQQFWAAWFWPLPPRSLADLAWPVVRLTGLFGGGGLRYPAPGFFIALGGVGAWALWRRSRGPALLLLAPFALTLVASALRVYPFAARVTLFLLPACLFCVAAGAEELRRLAASRLPWAGRAVVAACAVLAVWGIARNPPPYMPEHLKPVLAAVRRERRPGDAVYVYYGGEKAFRYYARRYGFGEGEYVLGGCWRGDPRAYLRELDRLRGRPRVWVVVTHALPELGEAPLILGYLDRIGTRRAAHRGSPSPRARGLAAADGYLYDLSDPARLGQAAAETFPIPPARRPVSSGAWSC